MAQILQKPAFTLIRSPKRRQVTEEFFPLPSQAELFTSYAPNVLVFVTLPRATDDEFISALDHAKPALVIDLRRFPRFDVGSLTRQRVFEEFALRQIVYIDYDWSSPETIGAEFACPYLRPETHRLRGTVMILLENRPHTQEITEALTNQIKALTGAHWDVVRIPSYLPNIVSSDLAFG